MNKLSWEANFGALLVALSASLYMVHYVVFGDPNHIFLWSMTSIAFLPISVLFVTLIVNRLLVRRDRSIRLDKLNMLIGTFFDEVGTEMLSFFAAWDPQLDEIRKLLLVTTEWSTPQFRKTSKQLATHHYAVDSGRVDLIQLKRFVKEKRDFLLRLLENPNLLEHESFTALLRAAFHLAQELERREGVEQLPSTDRQHLAGDMERVYGLLVDEWLAYMRYLKGQYPYLFSLAMRTNPFDQHASPIVA